MILAQLALGMAVLGAQSASELIHQLGDSRLVAREEASSRVIEIGVAAVPDLLRALDHPDSEIRGRAADLLLRLDPSQWLPENLERPHALEFFHHTHPPALGPDESADLARLLDQEGEMAINLDSRREMPGLRGLVLFRVGALSLVDGESLIFTGGALSGVAGDSRPVELRLDEGAILAAYQGEMPSQSFCRLLWERLLRDPQDPQAACLLADLLDPAFVRVLRTHLGRTDRSGAAALVLLSNYWAKKGQFDPTPEFFEQLKSQLESARWALVAPVSVLATKEPERFVPLLKAGFRSTNKWYQYLSLGMAPVGTTEELYDPKIRDFLASPLEDLRREAVRAMLALAPKGELPASDVVKAALGCESPDRFITAFRSRVDGRLGLELAKCASQSMALAAGVLGDYAGNDAVVEAFCASIPARVGDASVFDLLKLLGQFSEKPGREGPRWILARYLQDMDETVADWALRTLVAAALEGALPEIRSLLESPEPRLRLRGVEGCFALFRAGHAGSNTQAAARDLMASFLNREEKDIRVRELATKYSRAIQGKLVGVHPVERRRPDRPMESSPKIMHFDTGWKPLMSTPIPRPFWKD